MTQTQAGGPDRSAVKEALLAITRLNARIAELEARDNEPIAVIGIGCNLPGPIGDPEALWALLAEGRHAISEVPADRWDADALWAPDPGTAGRSYSRHGGFLDDVACFDEAFFGISPREAAKLDPQARLLLQVCWRALEDALQPLEKIRGSQTGLFMTTGEADYARHTMASTAIAQIDGHCKTGANRALSVGRIAYFLDTHGPVLHLDTSCSSSLVALHLACRSLRARECGMALVGGVNLLLAPEETVGFAALSALSPSGRCHTFAASADGYVRGEGVAVAVLKRLSDARADGDPVRAVILGSALNHDGRSNGLTAPNPAMQQSVVRAALANAGVTPADVCYVEAHGTGTQLGDPIELGALSHVFQRPEGQEPVFIGSLKANLGHLEPAAGAAGLLKAVLMAQHGAIPPQPDFTAPSTLFDWARGPFVVPTALTPFPPHRRHVIGISGFGMSGTNAHVVLEAAPPAATPPAATPPAATMGAVPSGAGAAPLILPVAARDDTALRRLVQQYEVLLAGHAQDEDIAGLCRAAATGRTHFAQRAAFVGADRLMLLSGVRAWLGTPPATDAAGGPGPITLAVGPEDALPQAAWADLVAAWPPLLRELEAMAPDAMAADLAGAQPWLTAAPHARSVLLRCALVRALQRLGLRFDRISALAGGETIAGLCAGRIGLREALQGVTVVPRHAADTVVPPHAADTVVPRHAADTDVPPQRGGLHIVLGSGGAGNGLSLLRGPDPLGAIFDVMAAAYRAGATLEWTAILGRGGFGRLRPPGHVLARNRHWVDRPPVDRPTVDRPTHDVRADEAPIELPALVADHVVANRVIVPGALLVSELLSQGQTLLGLRDVVLRDVAFQAPVVLASNERVLALRRLGADGTGLRLGLSAAGDRQASDGQTVGCACLVQDRRVAAALLPQAGSLPPDLAKTLPDGLNVAAHYAALLRLGLVLGPAFRTVAAIRTEGAQAFGRLSCATPLASSRPADIDARLLDGAFQVAASLWSLPGSPAPPPEGMLPVSVDWLWLQAPLTQDCVVAARARPGAAAQRPVADLDIFTLDGRLILSVSGLAFHLTAAAAPGGAQSPGTDERGSAPPSLAGLTEEGRQEALQDYVRALFAGSMGMQAAQIGLDANLQGLGADSLAIQEFRWQVQDDFGLDLAVRPVLEAATVRAIAALIAPLIAPQTGGPQTDGPQTDGPQTDGPQTGAPQAGAGQDVMEIVL